MEAKTERKKSSFGPGFLVTAAFIGPGTVTTCTLAGAGFGTALIYAMVFATLTTIILQNMTGRLSIGSGLDLAQSLREYPRKRATKLLFILLTLASITFGCAAYEAGNIIGGSLGLESVTGLDQRYWVGLISASAFLILLQRKYKLVERFLIFLVCLMSVSFLATVFIIKPDLGMVLKGFIPSFPKNSIYLILALIGTTVVPYNLFLHSSAVGQKWRNRDSLRYVKRDILVSVGLGGLLSMAIIVTSAVAFFASRTTPENGAQMAQQLRPLFGQAANILFGMGFFAAGLSSAITAPYAAAFASSGVLGWKKGIDSPGFRWVWTGVILLGFLVSLFRFNPIAVIVFAQVANGLILPVASIFLLLILNNRKQMGDLANTPLQNLLGVIIILVVTGLGLWNILRLFLH
jgi:manganese transport protein